MKRRRTVGSYHLIPGECDESAQPQLCDRLAAKDVLGVELVVRTAAQAQVGDGRRAAVGVRDDVIVPGMSLPR